MNIAVSVIWHLKMIHVSFFRLGTGLSNFSGRLVGVGVYTLPGSLAGYSSRASASAVKQVCVMNLCLLLT